MTSDATSSTRSPLREAMREGARELSGYWGWFLVLGIVWTLFGMYVLSYRVGSLAAVAALVGVAFLFGGITQPAVASRVQSWRWLYILSGIMGMAAGIGTFVWPGITLYVVSILVAWYLIAFGIIHLVDALAGPKLGYWWTGLLLGVAELARGGPRPTPTERRIRAGWRGPATRRMLGVPWQCQPRPRQPHGSRVRQRG
jgi:uncharacterized membrane protein HdeD (DUF308 family)